MTGTNKYINLIAGPGATGLPTGNAYNDLLTWNGQEWVPKQPDELPIGANLEFPFSFSAQVIVEHNLGIIPTVIVINEQGIEVICTITHDSLNRCVVQFSEYQSGTVIVK